MTPTTGTDCSKASATTPPRSCWREADRAAEAVRAAHRDYYLALAETAAPHLIGHGQAEWLDRLHLELDNLRAAISECAADPDPEPGLRLAHALHYFWLYREPSAEGALAVCAALDRPDAQAPTLLRGRALVCGRAPAYERRRRIRRGQAARSRSADDRACACPTSDSAPTRCAGFSLLVEAKVTRNTRAPLAKEAVGAARTVGDPHLTAQILFEASTSTRVTHERTRARSRRRPRARPADRRPSAECPHAHVVGYDAMEADDIATARPYSGAGRAPRSRYRRPIRANVLHAAT